MSASDWPPTRPDLNITSPPVLPKAAYGILSHQITYAFILRNLYSNANDQLLKVFNALFYPPSAALPVSMTLKEWHHLWSLRPLYRLSEEGMKDELERFTFIKDWICYKAAGEQETIDGVVYRKSARCAWEDVVEYIERVAGEAGVKLLRQ